MKSLLRNSVLFSLFVQIVTGIITFNGIFIKIPKKDAILTDVLILENIVQIIECIFYIYISYTLYKIDITSVTYKRYFDWMLTTPTMLLSTVMFMYYKNNIVNSDTNTNTNTTRSFLKQHKSQIIQIFFYNWMMLLFGFFGEINLLSTIYSIPLGFIFFILSFYTIFSNFVSEKSQFFQQISMDNKYLFYFLLGVWSLYGIAALLPNLQKNISYNLLDIIAKNFYGVYIYLQIKKIEIK